MGAASGLADLAALAFLKAAHVPPILNCDRPDPAVKLNLVRGKPHPLAKNVVLATTLAIGGQAAAAVVRINR
jgi:3-oxoacyl-[acyl-carrier-protein] synthase II